MLSTAHQRSSTPLKTPPELEYEAYETREIDELCNVLYRYKHGSFKERKIHFSCIFMVQGSSFKLVPVLKVLRKPNDEQLKISSEVTKNSTEVEIFVLRDNSSGLIKKFQGWSDFFHNYIQLSKEYLCLPREGTYGMCNINEKFHNFYFHINPLLRMYLDGSAVSVQGTGDALLSLPDLSYKKRTNLTPDDIISSCPTELSQSADEVKRIFLALNNKQFCPIDNAAIDLAANFVGAAGQIYLPTIFIFREMIKIAETSSGAEAKIKRFQFAHFLCFHFNYWVGPKEKQINCESISNLIGDVQSRLITQRQEILPGEQRKKYQRLIQQLGPSEPSQEYNARIVKQVIRARNIDEFEFYTCLPSQLIHDESQSISFSEDRPGLVTVKDAITLHPQKLKNLLDADPDNFLYACEQANRGFYDDKAIKNITKQHRVCFNYQVTEVRRRMDRLAEVISNKAKFENLEINGIQIFANMSSFQVERLGRTLGANPCNYDPRVVKIAMDLATLQGVATPQEFWCLLEFVTQVQLDKEDDIKNMLCLPPYKFMEICKANRVAGSTNMVTASALHEMSTDEGLRKLNYEFSALLEQAAVENKKLLRSFPHDYSAVYHYVKHCKWNGEKISLKDYFGKINKLLDNAKITKKYEYSQCGQYRYTEYRNEESVAVIYEFREPYYWKTILASMRPIDKKEWKSKGTCY